MCFILFLLAIAASSVQGASSVPNPESESHTTLGLRVECTTDLKRAPGEARSCLTLSGIRVDHHEKFSKKVESYVRLDPLGSPSKVYASWPILSERPLVKNYDLLIVDSFGATWHVRPSLALSLASYSGAARIPDSSGLALQPHFADSGWDQLALILGYKLPVGEELQFNLIAGNGEGSLVTSDRPQQYAGMEAHWNFLRGLWLHAGISLDGNYLGSKAQGWLLAEYQDRCALQWTQKGGWGYRTQRMSASVESDGNLDFARGWRFAAGLHYSKHNNTDHDQLAVPTFADLKNCEAIEAETFMAEDPNHGLSNTITHNTLAFSSSYRILDTYFLAAFYQQHTLQSQGYPFRQCRDYSYAAGATRCAEETSPSNQIGQWAAGVGGGMDLSEGLRLTAEYHITSYAHAYKWFFYRDRNGKATESRDLFNVRLAYNWN